MTTVTAASLTAVQIVAVNTSRKGLLLQNRSRSVAYVGISSGMTKNNAPILIGANGTFAFPSSGSLIYNGALFALWDEAEGNMEALEG